MKAQALISGWGPGSKCCFGRFISMEHGFGPELPSARNTRKFEGKYPFLHCPILVGQSQQAELTRAGIYWYQGLGG